MSVFALRLKRLHVGVRGHTHWLLITLRVGRGFLSCCGDGGVKAEPPQGKQSFDVSPVLQHGNLPAALAAGYTIINPSTALLDPLPTAGQTSAHAQIQTPSRGDRVTAKLKSSNQ